MHCEIERKFLVKGEFKSLAHDCVQIRQGYLCTEPGRTVRVRTWNDEAYITVKGSSEKGGRQRPEWEKAITPEDAANLLKLCLQPLIEKKRYLVKWENHLWEVDEFMGQHHGLLLAEVELKSADEQVLLPPFVGREVTGEKQYYNSWLSTHPLKP